MRYPVRFHPLAEAELLSIYDHIAEATSTDTAWAFISGMRTFCNALSEFPRRGTERVDIYPGLRLIGYRRAVTIAFAVEADHVIVLGIFYRGRNITAETFVSRQ